MKRSLKFTSCRPLFISLIGFLVVLTVLPFLFFASAAPISSAAIVQNPVCSALPVPTLQRGTDITAGVGQLNEFVIGDFNNDGKKDVVVEAWLPPGGVFTSSHSELRTYLGNGSGGFTLAGTYSTDYNRLVPGSAADFNGDGDGSLQPPRYFYAGELPHPGVVVDFNRDGKLDLAFPNYSTGLLATLLGLGNGNFGSPSFVNSSIGAGAEGIAVGDLNGQSAPDIVTTNSTRNTILVNFSEGSVSPYTIAGSQYLSAVQIVNYNGDGKNDIAVAGYLANCVVILRANGVSSFGNPTYDNVTPTIITVASRPLSLQNSDFDGSGKLDLAVVNSGSTTASVILNGCR